MSTGGKLRRALILLAFILLPIPAGAKKPPSKLERATALFKRGITEYRQSNFARALVHFKAALKLVNRPNVLLNVAQTHRKLGHTSKALFYYRQYLTAWRRTNAGKVSPFDKEVRSHIAKLQKRVTAAKHGNLSISSTPSGAQVFLGGRAVPGVTPLTLERLAVGDHPIELRKGSLRYRGKVTVAGARLTAISFMLTEQQGSLEVSTTPPGAELRIDGRLIGKTPQTLKGLALGSYTVELRKAHHTTARRLVRLDGSALRRVNVELQRQGAIAVATDPAGAEVYVDRRLVGKTPLQIDLEPGLRQIKLVLAGRDSVSRSVAVRAGATLQVKATLTVRDDIRRRLFSRRWRRVVGWISLPLGIVGGLVGAGLIVGGFIKRDESKQQYNDATVQQHMDYFLDQANNPSLLKPGWAVAGSSVALIALATYLLISAPSLPSAAERPTLHLGLGPAQGGVFATIGGGF